MTSASHPKMAVLRCWADQRPARAAMPPFDLRLIATLSWGVGVNECQTRDFRVRSHPGHPASRGARRARPGGAVDRTRRSDQTRPVRVVIADDSLLVREGIASLLR